MIVNAYYNKFNILRLTSLPRDHWVCAFSTSSTHNSSPFQSYSYGICSLSISLFSDRLLFCILLNVHVYTYGIILFDQIDNTMVLSGHFVYHLYVFTVWFCLLAVSQTFSE